jgi:hypothetical protein
MSDAATEQSDGPGVRLSFAEKLMWQAELSGAAVLPFFDCGRSLWLIMQLQGALNRQALESSLDTVLQRHDVLRSRFVARNGEPVRFTSQSSSFSFKTIERQDLPGKGTPEILESEVKPLLEHRFDLAHGPLLRSVLVELGRDDYILAVAVHHIVFDRWSTRLLESELSRFYSACVTRIEADVRPLRAQYQDYVLWQWKQLNSEHARKLSSYWANKLHGVPDLALPCSNNRGRLMSTQSGSFWFSVPAEEVSHLEVLSRRSRTTLAATMLAIFTLFLYKLCATDDIAVGVPLSDRRRPEFEDVIGLFMNVVVVRTSILARMTFFDLLDRLRRGLVDACLHQDLPYGYLQQIIPARSLYRVVFNFMPTVLGSELRFGELRAQLLPVPMELQSLADLSLHLRHEAGKLLCRLVYKADLFSQDSVRSFARQIQALTTAILQAPQNCIDTYHLE